MLHSTPFQSWEVANWTVDSLAARSGDIRHVLSKKGKSNVFKYFAVDQPMSGVDFLNIDKDYVEVVFTARTFFDLLRSPFDGFYYYASGGVELLNLGSVASDDESLQTMTFPSHSEAYSKPGQVNFWLGMANVTAYTHYDTSHNFHMVVDGRKRFILLPPDAYSRLKLHPCLHPLYRQVGVDVLSQGNLKQFIHDMQGYDVELTDGDVIYIPPYWFHTVVTMETTFSLNVWSQSEAFLAMEKIYSSAIPFEVEWGRVKLMKSLCYFIHLLVEEVLQDSDGSKFVVDRVYSRYKLILEKEPSKIEFVLSKVRASVQVYCLREEMTVLMDAEAVGHLEDGTTRIAESFRDIHPLPVREINLANYIEHLTWSMLGEEDSMQLPFYLYECFNKAVS